MTKLYILTLFLIFSFSSSSQTFRIYTAKANGNWSNAATWNSVVRTDNVQKNKYIIPASFTVVTAANYDYTTLGDVEVVVAGTLRLVVNTIFALTSNSTIDIFPDGEIQSVGASAIFIANSLKYISFGARTLSGPAYTDITIPGFANFTTLTSQMISFAGVLKDNVVSLTWTAGGESDYRRFEIEFSSNGSDWKSIGSVDASTIPTPQKQYNFSSRYTGSRSYYRLKQWSVTGGYLFSQTVLVDDGAAKLKVYAADRKINIQVDGQNGNAMVVKLLDLNGFVLQSRTVDPSVTRVSIDVSSFKTGTYIVHVTDQKKLQTVQRVMIF